MYPAKDAFGGWYFKPQHAQLSVPAGSTASGANFTFWMPAGDLGSLPTYSGGSLPAGFTNALNGALCAGSFFACSQPTW